SSRLRGSRTRSCSTVSSSSRSSATSAALSCGSDYPDGSIGHFRRTRGPSPPVLRAAPQAAPQSSSSRHLEDLGLALLRRKPEPDHVIAVLLASRVNREGRIGTDLLPTGSGDVDKAASG